MEDTLTRKIKLTRRDVEGTLEGVYSLKDAAFDWEENGVVITSEVSTVVESTPAVDQWSLDGIIMIPVQGFATSLHTGTSMTAHVKNAFTAEDVAAWGVDVAAILADILNGNYPADGAASDLRSLLAQKSERPSSKVGEWE